MMEGRQAAAGQHDASTWFIQSQLPSVIRNGIVPEWFHGIISRKTSEDLLMPKPPGYFLIRVSETRIGYTLSYRAADRCRHFMVDVRDDGQYIIVGENRYHKYLQDLVDFHRRNPIMPFSEVLTVACGQTSNSNTDYAELLFPKRHHKPNSRPPPNNFLQHSQSHPGSQDDIPPALPQRSNALCTSAAVPQVNTLYPNLETEFPNVAPQPPAMPVPKTRKRYLPESPQGNIPPELPVRSVAPLYQNEAFTTAVSPPRSSSPLTTNESSFGANVLPKYQEGKQLVISNLKNLKKKFQKHRSNSQDNVYTEISVATDSATIADNDYQELPGRQSENEESDDYESHSYVNSGVTADGVLPPEYLHPPPFAPGY